MSCVAVAQQLALPARAAHAARGSASSAQAGAGAMRAGDRSSFPARRCGCAGATFPAGRNARCGRPECGRDHSSGILELALDRRLLRFSSMSMKSMTIRPARSRRRSWRATSSAASRLVLSAVSSILCSRVERPGVHVDRDQRLGLVDDDVAAGFQRHLTFENIASSWLSTPKRAKSGVRIAVGLHVLGMARHEHAHEVLRLAVAVLAGDEDFVDVLGVEVADGALDQRAFLVDEGRGGRFAASARARSPTGASGIRSRA